MTCRECNVTSPDVIAFDLAQGSLRIAGPHCRACCIEIILHMVSYPQSIEALEWMARFYWKQELIMTFTERETLMKSIQPEQLYTALPAKPSPETLQAHERAERTYRLTALMLMADIAGSLQTFAYAQRELLKLHQEKAGRAPQQQPRPPQQQQPNKSGSPGR